jgi:nucleotide-binding universal stress UspA family protein
MYRRIIVAVGDYPQLDTPVAYAIALAAHTDAELWLLRVLTVPLIFGAPDMVTCAPLAMEHVMEAHAHVLACAVDAAEEAGVSYSATSRWGAIPDILMRTAEEADCDVIVVGSSACPGWPWPRSRYLARHVVARARQPVLVVPQPPPALYSAPLWSRLLVVHDGSPGADRAVEYALTLADEACLDACVLCLGIRWPSYKVPSLRYITRASTSPWGGISTVLETAAERRCDVIVLGTDHGLSWQRLWCGPIAKTQIATTDLPVLVVNRFTAFRC